MLRFLFHVFFPRNDKSGRAHWVAQRVSACALLPLYGWLLLSALPMAGKLHYNELLAWMGEPFNAVMIVLLIYFSMRHMALGMEVIIDDYIAHPTLNRIALLVMRWSTLLLALSVLTASAKIIFFPSFSL